MLLEVPGSRRIRSYRLVRGMDGPGPDFLSVHELAGPEVLEDPVTGRRSARRGRTGWWPRRCGGNDGCPACATRSAPSVASLSHPQVRELLARGTRTGKLSHGQGNGEGPRAGS